MTSLDECMPARITCTNSFYLGIDDFGVHLLIFNLLWLNYGKSVALHNIRMRITIIHRDIYGRSFPTTKNNNSVFLFMLFLPVQCDQIGLVLKGLIFKVAKTVAKSGFFT